MADGQIGESTDLFKLFVGQIPKEMDEISLRQYFEEFGPIVEVSIIRDNITMLSKGCAFVTYSYEHSAQMAMDKLHDKVQLPNSMNALQVRFAETQVDRDNKLFIGMLPKTLGEQDLHDLFSMYGELREVHVIRGPEGGAKGCAFVKFVEREAAVAAIENLNDTIPAGATRPLVVKFADGKKPAGKEDPWQGQQIPQTYRTMMGGGQQPLLQQQQRMMYQQYPAMGAGQSILPQPPQQQHSPYQQQRVMYMQQQQQQQSPTGPQGLPSGAYFNPASGSVTLPPAGSGSSDHSDPASPMYGGGGGGGGGSPQELQQLQQGGKAPSSEDFAGGGSTPPSNQSSGLEVLPPAQQQQQSGLVPQQFPIDSESSHVRPPEGPSGANLFIYHLPRDLTDADLATLFAPFGNVISAKVFVDKKTSDSKGFGFVSYDTLENANSAIESMNGFQIGSKRLKVQHKRVMGSTGGGPGGGQHSPYGAPSHLHHHHQQSGHHMGGHGGHHHQGQQQHSLYPSHGQQMQHQQQHQQSPYYRHAPALGSGGAMMGGPMLSQGMGMGGGGGGIGGLQGMSQYGMSGGGLGLHSQQPQQMGLPQQQQQQGQFGLRPSTLAGGPRMQQQGGGGGQMGGAGRANYGYSYPTLNSYSTVPGGAPQQQAQRPVPGMLPQQLGSGGLQGGPGQGQRVDMYGSSQQQQGGGSVGGGVAAYPSNDQQQHAAQSTHGAISYMDANSNNGGKPTQQQQQQQSPNVSSGFYGNQY